MQSFKQTNQIIHEGMVEGKNAVFYMYHIYLWCHCNEVTSYLHRYSIYSVIIFMK